jgi:hypothetical protein
MELKRPIRPGAAAPTADSNAHTEAADIFLLDYSTLATS